MNRRAYLLALGSVAAVGPSGCLGDSTSREGLSIEGAALTLGPGTEGVISASAYNAHRFQFLPPEIADLSRTDARVTPSADGQADSFPPGWVWNETQSTIEGELTIAVPSDVDRGEYSYGVTAANGDEQLRAEFTITVED